MIKQTERRKAFFLFEEIQQAAHPGTFIVIRTYDVGTIRINGGSAICMEYSHIGTGKLLNLYG